MPAHLFAYQLEHGIIPRLGWSGADDAVLCHQCDFADRTNPHHLRLGTNRSNRVRPAAPQYCQPLADVRGAAGRTRAVAAAVRLGLENKEDAEVIEERIRAAEGRRITAHAAADPAPYRHCALALQRDSWLVG